MDRKSFIRISTLSAGSWLLSELLPIRALGEGTKDDTPFQPSPLLKICADGKIMIYAQKQEMGQGISTALPLLLAEELDADPAMVTIEMLPYNALNAAKYNTYASASIRSNWMEMRRTGAAARAMLITAAAQQWQVSPDACRTENSLVIDINNGQAIAYEKLIAGANKLEIPKNPLLKEIKDFKLVGKKTKLADNKKNTIGTYRYGMDVRLPGMVYATIVRSPTFYGKVRSWDSSAVKRLGSGILEIIEVGQLGNGVDNRNGVAIIATSTWLALKAQGLLEVEWDLGHVAYTDSALLTTAMKAALMNDEPTLKFDAKGKSMDFDPTTGPSSISCEYELPYLAHFAMEPVNCTAWYKNGKYEMWGGFQAPGAFTTILPKAFGIDKTDISLHLMRMGGAFGRKEKVDNAAEAMLLTKAIGKPVQLVFSRFDDTRNDFYRPASYHKLTAVLSGNSISTWTHQVSIATFPGKAIATANDVYGGAAADLCYPVSKYQSAFYPVESPLPIGSWRSISYYHNVFVVESVIDELAESIKVDPVAFRLNLLRNYLTTIEEKRRKPLSRLANVLEKCAEAIGWKEKVGDGRFRGVACCEYSHAEAYAAHAFEISVSASKTVTIHKATCVIDCGFIVDPSGFRAQIEGSLVWAISALENKITLKDGQVGEQSYHDYEIARINKIPSLEIIIVDSIENPGGGGEPAIPSVAPALSNAIAAATGIRMRKLPLQEQGFHLADRIS